MPFHKWNTLVGWLIFATATTIYLLTLEPTASFWDCGEFIASSYKLQVPHPPGAPAFLLLGRLFSLLSFGNVTKVAVLINGLSALSSGFTVLFLFWIITHLARKLVVPSDAKAGNLPPASLPPSGAQTCLILSAGAVGALAFAFSDSFWFNAVEGEVYALSTLCTAAVVWIMLQWESHADEPDSARWLLLIAYIIGLSIGVHLLNLLTLPALGLIYYYRRTPKPTLAGSLLTLGGSFALLGLVLVGIIPGLPALAGQLEVALVNSLGVPFNTGIVLFLVLLAGFIYAGFRVSFRLQSPRLNTLMLGFVFLLIGYSSYLVVPIRSSFQPTINENNPSDVLSFVSYLRREQYGAHPLLYGPQFDAQPIGYQDLAPRYRRDLKSKTYQEILPREQEPMYRPEDKVFLPRLYSSNLQEYQKWVPDLQAGVRPTLAQNLTFLVKYQLGHMFWRYFGWNYVGRDSDIQQAGVVTPFGPARSTLPTRIGQSFAHNNFLALPLLLGLLGLWYQVRRARQDAWVAGWLFFMTGLAIVLYLNQPPFEPRERDYTYTGATFAFAIWIGLGVLGLAAVLGKVVRAERLRVGLALALALVIPGILVVQGWNDHDRSHRYLSEDFAKNLLDSCAPNAILFTNGDNDTFPLWYVQEVEGYRTDVRVAVLSYLNTDWYIQQMRRRAYRSAPFPLALPATAYASGTNDFLPYVANPAVQRMNLREFLGLVKDQNPLLQAQAPAGGARLLALPASSFFLPVDTAAVKRLGIIPADRHRQLVSHLDWHMGESGIEKKSLVLLDLIATNNWQRPLYFSSTVNPDDFLNLQPYFQLEGLAYRLLPLRNPAPSTPEQVGYVELDLNYQKLINTFAYRGLRDDTIFYDENNLHFPTNYREKFARLAAAYLAAGNRQQAAAVATFCLQVLPNAAIQYDFYSPQLVPALVAGGERARANEILDTTARQAQQVLTYAAAHPDGSISEDTQATSYLTLQSVYRAAVQVGDTARAARTLAVLRPFLPTN
ncbi:DUF2723 domain-containing protein [Hymenobacter ginsengisoli]|uniref:DUF2723 domain-containing protein n=1 Tax=Hymenobacter ginsengisoli TaxID=1051626 RepID=A0ABP8QRZ4_9BACT|nr:MULTISPECIES: DUF2723 domain-containing protein [unclassified Hymenobacter]MBO2033409.1 DUF2723 domain-containing protein [Hymenobacter sp. BT559]